METFPLTRAIEALYCGAQVPEAGVVWFARSARGGRVRMKSRAGCVIPLYRLFSIFFFWFSLCFLWCCCCEIGDKRDGAPAGARDDPPLRKRPAPDGAPK